MSTPHDLATQLQDLTPPEYVRFVAQWIDAATEADIQQRPELTGDSVVDALVAAAAAFVGFRRYGAEPAWTSEPSRIFRGLWHPGHPGFFAWSLVHSPASFRVRGILIEEDSLTSV